MRCRITASLRATATVAFRYFNLWCREPELVRWEGQCISAVGEPRKRPHCLMCLGYGGRLKHQSRTRSPASAGLEHTSYSVIDTYRRGWHHVKAKSCH